MVEEERLVPKNSVEWDFIQASKNLEKANKDYSKLSKDYDSAYRKYRKNIKDSQRYQEVNTEIKWLQDMIKEAINIRRQLGKMVLPPELLDAKSARDAAWMEYNSVFNSELLVFRNKKKIVEE